MRAGTLRHRITVERDTADGDSPTLGEVTPNWTTLCDRRAQKVAVGTRETFGSDVRYAESEYVYRVRYDPTTSTITARDRVVDGSAVYGIDGVADPTGLKKEIELFVTRTDDG